MAVLVSVKNTGCSFVSYCPTEVQILLRLPSIALEGYAKSYYSSSQKRLDFLSINVADLSLVVQLRYVKNEQCYFKCYLLVFHRA